MGADGADNETSQKIALFGPSPEYVEWHSMPFLDDLDPISDVKTSIKILVLS